MHETLERVRAGEDDPGCTECGGILKSATISFGENLVPGDLERSQVAAGRADVFLAIGTSLGVYPAAGLPEIALRNGARLVILNARGDALRPRRRRGRTRPTGRRAARAGRPRLTVGNIRPMR